MTDRWQKFSDVFLDEEVLAFLADYADEFLVHGVDVEGKKWVVKCSAIFFVYVYSFIYSEICLVAADSALMKS